MPKIYNIKNLNSKEIIKEIKKGKIFIYPTDTIYGLGCNALDSEAVKRLRNIKKRTSKPFSVIAPNKNWIYKNFEVKKKEHIAKLPGPFTFILKKKGEVVAKEVNLGLDSLGVRLFDNEFSRIIQKANVPFVTTSVNITNERYATSIKSIDREIFDNVDIIIENGILDNKPSILLDYTKSTYPIIVKRRK